ncbi:hypothetical protein B0H15DRAFT_805404 [Mycena belliarum]|uniref:Uncharacterized protein n=1 Tax=Mycena belliarum TaxID=1033014 RepID=A0AAD6XIF4_9AGAR|nr:hypothetical protein B0H15DRAFT_805404 [Mycena belliae]
MASGDSDLADGVEMGASLRWAYIGLRRTHRRRGREALQTRKRCLERLLFREDGSHWQQEAPSRHPCVATAVDASLLLFSAQILFRRTLLHLETIMFRQAEGGDPKLTRASLRERVLRYVRIKLQNGNKDSDSDQSIIHVAAFVVCGGEHVGYTCAGELSAVRRGSAASGARGRSAKASSAHRFQRAVAATWQGGRPRRDEFVRLFSAAERGRQMIGMRGLARELGSMRRAALRRQHLSCP